MSGASGTSSTAGATATSNATGTASLAGTALSWLADKFDQAAQTGDLSSLMPPRPPRGGFGGSTGTRSTGTRAEAAYGAASQTDGTPDAILQRLFKQAGSDAGTGSSMSDTDVQRQIAVLRQQIAALTASLSNASSGGTTGVGA